MRATSASQWDRPGGTSGSRVPRRSGQRRGLARAFEGGLRFRVAETFDAPAGTTVFVERNAACVWPLAAPARYLLVLKRQGSSG
jgi:hypothetical protein